MKAMIFAAGLGTRLKPFTLTHPKALVPLDGVPMLARVARRLIDAGVDTLVINVHHFADQIREFLAQVDDFGIRVDVSDETDTLLDTGGGILVARHLLDGDEPFIVHNADILTNVDLRDMYECHCQSGAMATLLASPRKTSRYLYFGTDKMMKGWGNISTGEFRPSGFVPDESFERLAFGGVHVLSPKIFDSLARYTTERVFSIMSFYVDKCRSLNIEAYTPRDDDFRWYDVGRPETLEEAQNYLEHHNI